MKIQEFLVQLFFDFISILSEMSPYLLLGFFFAGLLKAFIPKSKIEKYFNGKGIKAPFLAAIFGIPLPLCSCGVIPTGIAFYKNGASKGGSISFLISTPQTGVDSILATFSLMGLPFAIIRPIAALITGVTGGLITSVVTKNETPVNTLPDENEKQLSFKEKIVLVFKFGFVEFIQDISKWLVIGLVLAAIISALIPNNFFDLFNLSPILQMLLVLIVSIPMYICATGSIPLAAILILKGLSPGAAFVLLMAGPATNAATITMIAKVLGRKSLITYLSSIIVGALSFALLIDYVFPVEWFNQNLNYHSGHGHEMDHLAWWQIGSGIILMLLITYGYILKFRKPSIGSNNTQTFNVMNIQEIKVEGMTCNHCKANVESNLEKLDFVTKVSANINTQTVVVEGKDIDMNKVKNLIEEIGYTVS